MWYTKENKVSSKESPRVLIVDDSRMMLKKLREIFSEEKFEVVAEAEYGEEAISFYKEFNPDLVTMDVVMPDMTGVEALKEIIKYDSTAKVIMCSALTYDSLITDAIKAGAKGYIKKPLQHEEVIKTAKKILNR